MSNQKKQEAYLRETKQLMRSKLEEHGVEITDATPFRAYVEGIDEAVEKAVASVEPEVPEGVEELRKKISLILSIETLDDLELTAEDFEGLEFVRRYALYSHPALTSVEIADNVKAIDPTAFYGCAKLETVRLPKKVKLQASCFGNCTAIKSVYLPAVTDASECPVLANPNAFPSRLIAPDITYIVPDQGSLDIYATASYWKSYVEEGNFKLLEEVTEE